MKDRVKNELRTEGNSSHDLIALLLIQKHFMEYKSNETSHTSKEEREKQTTK